MIQRIQTVFLFLAALFFFGEFAFPFFTSEATATGFFSDSAYSVQDHPALLGLAIGGGVISLVSLFLFNNRSIQQKLVFLSIALAIGLLVAAIILGLSDTPTLFESSSLFIGSFLPIGSLIMLVLSLRGINKDEKIVKSMDRLR